MIPCWTQELLVLIFFNGWFGNLLISNKLALRGRLLMSCWTQETAQPVRWSCEPIILSIGHFESLTEVQLNSWRKTVCLWWLIVTVLIYRYFFYDLLVHHVLSSSCPFVPISYQMYVYQMILSTVYCEMTWCTSNGNVMVICRVQLNPPSPLHHPRYIIFLLLLRLKFHVWKSIM